MLCRCPRQITRNHIIMAIAGDCATTRPKDAGAGRASPAATASNSPDWKAVSSSKGSDAIRRGAGPISMTSSITGVARVDV